MRGVSEGAWENKFCRFGLFVYFCIAEVRRSSFAFGCKILSSN